MAVETFYNPNGAGTFRDGLGSGQSKTLPRISKGLDSIRVYNFEVHFRGIPSPGVANGRENNLVLAAKKVTSAGHNVEDIPVRRLNDLLYYPGAANSDELTITFDHLVYDPTSEDLFNWFKGATYNPNTGIVAGAKTASIDVVYLTNARQIRSINTYVGVYPKSFKPAESNYATSNEFHTFDVIFRYDFMDHNLVNTFSPITQPAALDPNQIGGGDSALA